MDFTQEYQQKLVSAEEAVKVIKSGDWRSEERRVGKECM